MREPTNFANAIVIIACIYFFISVSSWWIKAGLILLLLFAVVTWAYWHVTEDQKKLLQVQIQEAEARIKNLNAGTAFATTQSALAIKGIKNV